ncbi:MAG: AAA family ATPase [Elainellaceae cyanobacterium]
MPELPLFEAEILKTCHSLEQSESVLLIGEAGSGKSYIAAAICKHFEQQGWTAAIATYGGSAKQTLLDLCETLGVATVTDDEKPKNLTAEGLRQALLKRVVKARHLLIVENSQRFPASLRYWLEEVLDAEGLLLLTATDPPARDLFLKFPRIAVPPLSADEVRSVMYAVAQEMGVTLTASKYAELQQRVGGNLRLAGQILREDKIGIAAAQQSDHQAQYVDGTPFLVAGLSAVGIIRFIGIGLGDKALYLVGGIATILTFSLRTLFYAANRRTNAGRLTSR